MTRIYAFGAYILALALIVLTGIGLAAEYIPASVACWVYLVAIIGGCMAARVMGETE